MKRASPRISALYLGIVILGLFPAIAAAADDEVSETTEPNEIEAKAYDLKTIRPSKSGRVYLFQKFEPDLPVDGKIFLLREGDTPVMAFRVLKTYPQTKRIAAKKLLPYEGFPSLDRGSQYRAFEKIGEKVAPIPPSPEDLQDLNELEGDAVEDLTTIPPPEGEVAPPTEEIPAEPPAEAPSEESPAGPESFREPGEEDPEVRDTEDPDEYDEVGGYFPNFFTMGVGWFAKMKVPGPSTKFAGGLLYSRNFGDAWAGEGGFFYYRSSGEESNGTITMTVMPLVGTLRYQRRWSDLWTGYAYAGLVYPYVASNVGATKKQLAQIQTVWPAFGVGTFLQTGPNWYLRLNLGYDAIYLGVSLRF